MINKINITILLLLLLSCDNGSSTNNIPQEDCSGVLDGEAFLDDCGVCSGSNTGHVENSDQDCQGVCFGEAYITGCNLDAIEGFDCVLPESAEAIACVFDCTGEIIHEDCTDSLISGCADYDDCGICSGGTSNHIANSDVDCFSVCFGDALYDSCEICNGPGPIYECGCTLIPMEDCDCNANQDDECGICGGDGIVEGTCDCDGNIIDNCGVCGGNNQDDSPSCPVCFTETLQSTISEIDCVPNLFNHIVTTASCGYFFASVSIENNSEVEIDSNDWVGAFNGDTCVGAQQWDTSACGTELCGISVYGATTNYMSFGDYPSFKVYDTSAGVYIDVFPFEEHAWSQFGTHFISSLNINN